MSKKLLYLQTMILAGGVVFSWSRVVIQISGFNSSYETSTNPLVTACFYGALAFIAALIWSGIILQYESMDIKKEKYLRNFLLLGTLFALTIWGSELLTYYKIINIPLSALSCAPDTNPFLTPCFGGLLFFLGAFLTALIITSTHKSKTDSEKILEPS